MVQLVWVSLPEFENQEYKKALSILGYKVYGNLETLRTDGHIDLWNDHMMGKKNVDFYTVFKGYDAIIQAPPTYYYQEILQAYPNAKVIMEVVDSLTWYKRIMRVKNFFWWLNWLRIFKKTGKYLTMMDRVFYILLKGDISPINAQIRYHDFIEEVKNTVPRHKLLVISPEEGWEPICSFLNKPIPTDKFPISVDDSDLNKTARSVIFSTLRKNSIPLILYFGTLISLFIYLLFFYQ